jgi:deoxyribodipyrimidine photo-lyase
MDEIEKISQDERITARKGGLPLSDGSCVVYWMQSAQRAADNPALNVAVHVANELGKPVVVFLPRYHFIREQI